VGTYGAFVTNQAVDLSQGNTRAGSGLWWSSFGGYNLNVTPSGTWRLMGVVRALDDIDDLGSVWLRIS
jgi:hypothetical protein